MAWGLVAGLRTEEMWTMPPGLILDLFVYRRDYDDFEHGIHRQEERIYD